MALFDSVDILQGITGGLHAIAGAIEDHKKKKESAEQLGNLYKSALRAGIPSNQAEMLVWQAARGGSTDLAQAWATIKEKETNTDATKVDTAIKKEMFDLEKKYGRYSPEMMRMALEKGQVDLDLARLDRSGRARMLDYMEHNGMLTPEQAQDAETKAAQLRTQLDIAKLNSQTALKEASLRETGANERTRMNIGATLTQEDLRNKSAIDQTKIQTFGGEAGVAGVTPDMTTTSERLGQVKATTAFNKLDVDSQNRIYEAVSKVAQGILENTTDKDMTYEKAFDQAWNARMRYMDEGSGGGGAGGGGADTNTTKAPTPSFAKKYPKFEQFKAELDMQLARREITLEQYNKTLENGQRYYRSVGQDVGAQ